MFLLLKADQSVEQIAAAVGYPTSHFASSMIPSRPQTVSYNHADQLYQECVYFPDFLNRPANWIAAQTMKKFW